MLVRRCLLVAALFLTGILSVSAQYNVKKLMEEGRETLDKGYYLVAMQIFSRILSVKPNLYEPWFLRGTAKYQLDDFEGAEGDCSAAINLNPYVDEIYELRAMSRIRLEKYDSAAVDYTHAVELNKDNRDYWYNRAYCYYYGGQTALALQQLDYILKRWPQFHEAIVLRRDILNGKPAPAKEKYIDKNGKEQTRMTKSTMMNEVDDARVLSSGYPKDERYALYANQLKSLANQARKDILSAGSIEKKPSMAKMYAAEVADLDSQLNEAKKNAPRERMAQVLARSDVEAKKVANPGMQKSEIKKASQIAIKKRRAEVGAHHVSIEISDRQWEAIQNGAISENKLREILNHTDIDKLRQRATPRTTTQLSSVKQAQIKAMAASGYSNKEIADKLGISSTTVGKYL